jgi:hypothetical protein
VLWKMLVVVGGLLVGSGTGQSATGQSMDCRQRYAQAERAYYRAEFQDAIDLLGPCLNKAGAEAATVEVYRLYAFAHLATGNDTDARLTVEDLLDARPGYTPNPDEDRPDYVALVEDVKASRRPAEEDATPQRSRRWVRWVVASVVVLATAAVVSVVADGGDGGNGDDDDDFDDDFDND